MRDEKTPSGELILDESSAGKVRVEVYYDEETFWLSERRMAELFALDVRTVNAHLVEVPATFLESSGMAAT